MLDNSSIFYPYPPVYHLFVLFLAYKCIIAPMNKELTPAPVSAAEPTEKDLTLVEQEYIKNYEFDYSTLERIEVNGSEIGLYLATLPKVKINTREQDEVLAKRIVRGDNPAEAKEALFYSVARMVVWQAVKRGQGQRHTMDLIQEGNLAVWEKAIPKYDYRRSKFSTYAMWWIQQSQKRAMIGANRIDRIPESSAYQIKHINTFVNTFTAANGKKPTTFEIAEKTGIKPARVNELMDMARQKYISLSEPTGESGTEFGDSVKDEGAIYGSRLEDRVEFEILSKKISAEIATFPEREARILRLRLGINEKGEWTGAGMNLLELSRMIDSLTADGPVTRERARQLQRHSIDMFKELSLRRALKKFLDPDSENRHKH